MIFLNWVWKYQTPNINIQGNFKSIIIILNTFYVHICTNNNSSFSRLEDPARLSGIVVVVEKDNLAKLELPASEWMCNDDEARMQLGNGTEGGAALKGRRRHGGRLICGGGSRFLRRVSPHHALARPPQQQPEEQTIIALALWLLYAASLSH